MSKITQILVTARSLIADRDRWCQGHNAEDAAGNMVSVTGEPVGVPVRWCAMGALMRTLDTADDLDLGYFGLDDPRDTAQAITYNLLDAAARELGFNDVVELNDWVSPDPPAFRYARRAAHTNVMQMYDLAITASKLDQLEAP